jgi:hypothetical protein
MISAFLHSSSFSKSELTPRRAFSAEVRIDNFQIFHQSVSSMLRRQHGWFRMVSMAMAATFMLVLLFNVLNNHFEADTSRLAELRAAYANDSGKTIRMDSYIPVSEVKPKPVVQADKQIFVGMQIENIYNLSLKDRIFMADGWYWLKWPESVNAILKDNDISLDRVISFTNQVEASSMVVEMDEPNPEILENGDYWQLFKFSGKFYIQDLHLLAFPYDVLSLPILLEPQPEVLSCRPGSPHGCVLMSLDPNAMGSKLGSYVDLNGYNVIGIETKEYLHQYNTNFGQGGRFAVSSVGFDVIYRTNFAAAFWSYVFPLLVLIIIVIIAPSLPGSLGDVRLAIPTTILLTLIFLQIGYKQELPPLAYVTYLDWLYIYAYIVSAVFFVLFCWGINLHAKASAQGHEESAIRRIDQVDSYVQIIAFLGLALMLGSGLLIRP